MMEDFEDFMNANPSGELPEDFKTTAGKPLEEKAKKQRLRKL